MRTNPNATGGMTFLDALLLAFVILKLTGTIEWSWLWVLSPLWVVVLVFVVTFYTDLRR